MSVLERCPSYKESNKGNKQKTGTNSRCPFYGGVRLIEVSVKRKSTVVIDINFIYLTVGLWAPDIDLKALGCLSNQVFSRIKVRKKLIYSL